MMISSEIVGLAGAGLYFKYGAVGLAFAGGAVRTVMISFFSFVGFIRCVKKLTEW